MTGDSIAITVAAFLFFAWLVAWVLLATRRPKRDFVLRWDADGIEQGDYVRNDNGE